MSEGKLIQVQSSELDMIKRWGTQYVLMCKQDFIKEDAVVVQKSQQLIDKLESQPEYGIEAIEKIDKEKRELAQDRKNKDNPYGNIGEVYGAE